jgi:hypothetical protein
VKPTIKDTGFGYITVEGTRIEHDILIRMSGQIKKRKKRLSKDVYGTSHIISQEEAEHIHQEGAELLIIGSGQEGMVRLSEEAAEYFRKKGCEVDLLPTPRAIQQWNEAKGHVIGFFHVTC